MHVKFSERKKITVNLVHVKTKKIKNKTAHSRFEMRICTRSNTLYNNLSFHSPFSFTLFLLTKPQIQKLTLEWK